MATQRKVGTSLNDERQRKLAELVASDPFACASSVLAVALDLMYAAFQQAGRDIKAALEAIGLPGEPAGRAA